MVLYVLIESLSKTLERPYGQPIINLNLKAKPCCLFLTNKGRENGTQRSWMSAIDNWVNWLKHDTDFVISLYL